MNYQLMDDDQDSAVPICFRSDFLIRHFLVGDKKEVDRSTISFTPLVSVISKLPRWRFGAWRIDKSEFHLSVRLFNDYVRPALRPGIRLIRLLDFRNPHAGKFRLHFGPSTIDCLRRGYQGAQQENYANQYELSHHVVRSSPS